MRKRGCVFHSPLPSITTPWCQQVGPSMEPLNNKGWASGGVHGCVTQRLPENHVNAAVLSRQVPVPRHTNSRPPSSSRRRCRRCRRHHRHRHRHRHRRCRCRCRRRRRRHLPLPEWQHGFRQGGGGSFSLISCRTSLTRYAKQKHSRTAHVQNS